MEAQIAVLGGDGIGPEVTASSMQILDAVGERFGHEFKFVSGPIGGHAIDALGTPLPRKTLNLVLESDAVLFGAVGGPKWDDPQAPMRPEDAILQLRRTLGLFANIRPVKVYPSLISLSPLDAERLGRVDFVIVRELTGGLYFGTPKRRWENTRGRKAVDTLAYSEKEISRVLKVGFDLAKQRKSKLHSVDKMNVLETGRLWREIAIEMGREDYPDVELIHMLVDNAAMQIVSDPSQFDVLVTENTFGDILSDEAAVITGSMGMMPSASLSRSPDTDSSSRRRRRSNLPMLYEPIHGSAPDIAGQNKANPIASILSSAMLLRHSFGLHHEADVVEEAVEAILDEGIRTADIARENDRPYSTEMVAQLIVGHIAS